MSRRQAQKEDINLPLDGLSDVTAPSPSVGDGLYWDGEAWINAATSPSGGVGIENRFYLDITQSLADNFTLSTAPSAYAETANAQSTTSATSPVFFERFVSGPLGRTLIPAGTWTFNIYGSVSNDAGDNRIKFRVNKRVIQIGMTGTFTGSGATRTFTVTGGTPFVAGDANADRLKAGLIETPNQTAWISAYTSSTIVTVTLTDPAYVNESDVSLNAIYYYLFDTQTADLSGSSPALYTVVSSQSQFSINPTDRLVLALFSYNDTGTHTITLYYGGTTNFTHFISPLTLLHNDLAGLNDGDYKHLTAADNTEAVAFLDGGESTHTEVDAGLVTNGDGHTHASGDGASLTSNSMTNRTRYLSFVSLWDAGAGATVPSSDAHGSLSTETHWHLADGGLTTLKSTFSLPVPADYVNGTVNIVYLWSCSVTGNNVRLPIVVREAGDGDTTHTTLLSSAADVAVTAANTITKRTVALTTNPTAGKAITVSIQRDGAHANDTNTGQVSIWACWLEYTADM